MTDKLQDINEIHISAGNDSNQAHQKILNLKSSSGKEKNLAFTCICQ